MLRKKIGIALIGIICLITTGLASAHLEKVIQLHFQYGAHQSLLSGNSIDASKNTTDLWFLFSEAENFIQTDIAQLLDSDQREQYLVNYLRDGENLLAELNSQQRNLEVELQTIENKMTSCQSSLDAANALFSISLQNNQENWFYRSVDQAKKARSCLGEQFVMKSATQNLLSKLQSNQHAIEPRFTYLNTNKDIILKHYDILKPSLLAELYKISVMLEKK